MSALNSCLPASPSMSITAMPDPVASAILASGQRVHQCVIWAGSSVASLNPPRVRGCFPGEAHALPQLQAGPADVGAMEWHGKIRQRIRLYARAASSFTFTWKPLARPGGTCYKGLSIIHLYRRKLQPRPQPRGFFRNAFLMLMSQIADTEHALGVTVSSRTFSGSRSDLKIFSMALFTNAIICVHCAL